MNKKLHKALCLLLCMVMCLSLLPVNAFAAEGETVPEEGAAVLAEGEYPGEVPEENPAEVIPEETETAPEEEIPEETETAPEEEIPEEAETAPAEEIPEEVEAAPAEETPEEVEAAPEEPVEPEILPVRVEFRCDPADAAITVFHGDDPAEDRKPLEAEADESYLLLPGEYVYCASREGFAAVENEPFTVTASEQPLVITVSLSLIAPEEQIPEEEPAQEPAEIPEVEPAEEPVEIPEVEPAEEPVEIPEVEPAEEPVEIPEEEPAEEPVEIPEEEPAQEPGEVPEVVPAEEPVEVPEEEPAEEPVVAPLEPLPMPVKPVLDPEKEPEQPQGLPTAEPESDEPAEEPEEEPAETEDAEEEIFFEEVYLDEEFPNDQILNEYVQHMFYPDSELTYGVKDSVKVSESLSGGALYLERQLKSAVAQIATGSRTSTIVTVDLSSTSYTVPNINSQYTQDGSNFGLKKIFYTLIKDATYEMYWFDRYASWSYSTTSITFTFDVSSDYQSSSDEHTVNSSKVTAANNAVANAKRIVAKYSSYSDMEKLRAYKNEICSLVEYNHDAVNQGIYSYGPDPWELVYVFDGNSSTNVVCEGYSKAYEYLCNQTSFSSSLINCICVDGYTYFSGGGSGAHMWNIVTLDDGKNYLVDVTNCDTGSTGSDVRFLIYATSGSYNSTTGYYVTSGDRYTYYNPDGSSESIPAFSAKALTLATSAYSGPIQKTGWEQSGGNWYYYVDGVKVTGWKQISSGKWYYFNSSGVMQTGWTKVSGKWYYMNSSGVMQKGWLKLSGKWYYLDSSGAMQTGWTKVSGKWYYLDSSGVMQTGWTKVSGKWYYLDSSGVMQTGWLKLSGKWYYLDSSGVMQKGWLKLSGKWYYLDSSGVMQTGWTKVSGKWYYMNSSGVMQTGWTKVAGNWFYLDSSGVMQTGWLQLSGKWYYLNANGAMAVGWQNVSTKWYYFDSNGVMLTGWQRIGSNWYYFETSGVMLANTSKKINGVTYHFDKNGVCTDF